MPAGQFFSDRVIRFNRSLHYTGDPLPDGIGIMNPFRESPVARTASEAFYEKFYQDESRRWLILGINPGRFGAGLTGVPFTDPKRLVADCGIPYDGPPAHEPSSVFIYEMIHAYGGPVSFYRDFYINSVCPLGFVKQLGNGREVNYNYYDDAALARTVEKFILTNIRKQIRLGTHTQTVFCFGTGKNENYLRRLNDRYGFFDQLIALEHPRFIMQYRAKQKTYYIDKYLAAFHQATA